MNFVRRQYSHAQGSVEIRAGESLNPYCSPKIGGAALQSMGVSTTVAWVSKLSSRLNKWFLPPKVFNVLIERGTCSGHNSR